MMIEGYRAKPRDEDEAKRNLSGAADLKTGL